MGCESHFTFTYKKLKIVLSSLGPTSTWVLAIFIIYKVVPILSQVKLTRWVRLGITDF